MNRLDRSTSLYTQQTFHGYGFYWEDTIGLYTQNNLVIIQLVFNNPVTSNCKRDTILSYCRFHIIATPPFPTLRAQSTLSELSETAKLEYALLILHKKCKSLS